MIDTIYNTVYANCYLSIPKVVPLHHQNNNNINQLKRKGFNYDKENIVPEEVAETK